ncbi:hypothetical protein DVH05_006615 [Phytophthora capsici]|nr:hypothetical protein DVH05_006615 [Phytophthora capsici]
MLEFWGGMGNCDVLNQKEVDILKDMMLAMRLNVGSAVKSNNKKKLNNSIFAKMRSLLQVSLGLSAQETRNHLTSLEFATEVQLPVLMRPNCVLPAYPWATVRAVVREPAEAVPD